MKSHYWKIFRIAMYCSTLCMPSALICMDASGDEFEDHDNHHAIEMDDMADLEAGKHFTLQNTQVAVITGESIGNFITQNKNISVFNPQNRTALDLIRNCNLKAFKNLAQQDVIRIIDGVNGLYEQDVCDQFAFHRIDMTSPLAHDQILHALGNITGQYWSQDERPYGFNIIILLRNHTELWLCEIPSKSELAAIKKKRLRAGEEASPFEGKEAEVVSAMTMFEPLLSKLFLEGRSQEVQERRKACWSCTKGAAVILVIIIVAGFMFVGAATGLIGAINSIQDSASS
ncbi:hypothetical protein JST56_04735 [Candidatus Dependentiae bacterium]|nr:hypothetical protein [Candidatus Dependentiae bacterium]